MGLTHMNEDWFDDWLDYMAVPTLALYLGPSHRRAILLAFPQWYMALVRMAPGYHRQAMMWIHMYTLELRQQMLNPDPIIITLHA